MSIHSSYIFLYFFNFVKVLFVLILLTTHFIPSMGYAVAQFVEALRYNLEGRGFDTRWCIWNFSLTILPAALWPLSQSSL
jgi:hypothetical protein